MGLKNFRNYSNRYIIFQLSEPSSHAVFKSNNVLISCMLTNFVDPKQKGK